MSEHELMNADFEADWSEESNHRCLAIYDDDAIVEIEVGNIFVPPKWRFWFRHVPGTYDQPEGRDTFSERRIHGGRKAYMWFTFNRSHDAGLLQRVSTRPNVPLRFTFWAHAWSNQKDEKYAQDFPHPDDARWSEGAGFEQVAWAAGTLPNNTGDRQMDAKPNFTFWAGIDPTGGINPLADTVVWGKGYHIYNGYVRPLEVEATALSDTATVFIRSRTLWNFKHNDAYVDDAEVAILEQDGIVLHLQTEGPYVEDVVSAIAVSEGELEDVRFSVAIAGTDFPLDATNSRLDYWEDQGQHFWKVEFRVNDEGLHTLLVESDTCSDVLSFEVRGHRGDPREQYERTYVLLPPDADATWAAAVADVGYREGGPRFTIGGSADDAGIGDLDKRRVVAVNPGNWPGPQTLEEFFTLYYPGVEYVAIEVATPDELAAKLEAL